jgi:hypothetical protein
VEQGYGVCGARDERAHAGQQQQLVDQLGHDVLPRSGSGKTTTWEQELWFRDDMRTDQRLFEGTKRMCSMVQVGLNYRFGLQPTEDAAQNGDDLRRDPLEVRKTTRARRSYFRDVATGAFIFR